MSHCIIYVPGKNPKPPPEVHAEHLWRCIFYGATRSVPELKHSIEATRFDLAGWNFHYYHEHKSLTADIPWIDKLLENPDASTADIEEARSWRKWSIKMMYILGDHFHTLIHYIPDPRVKAMINDTLRYFENIDNVADEIRNIVKEKIKSASHQGKRICIIGHSMGSIIAYESLWQLTHRDENPHEIDLFLTLGSPLGMHYVQKRLLGFHDGFNRFPTGIKHWVNISAVGDLVSVDETVADDFRPMIKDGSTQSIEDIYGNIYTAFKNDQGLNVHKSFGYLVHQQVSEILTHWWQEQLC